MKKIRIVFSKNEKINSFILGTFFGMLFLYLIYVFGKPCHVPGYDVFFDFWWLW